MEIGKIQINTIEAKEEQGGSGCGNSDWMFFKLGKEDDPNFDINITPSIGVALLFQPSFLMLTTRNVDSVLILSDKIDSIDDTFDSFVTTGCAIKKGVYNFTSQGIGIVTLNSEDDFHNFILSNAPNYSIDAIKATIVSASESEFFEYLIQTKFT